MTDGSSLPEPVRCLLEERLDSIAQLEVLLLLHRSAPEVWDAQRIAAELRIEPDWARGQLAALRERGLLAESQDEPGRFRFEAADPRLAKAVEALAISYNERRVTVIALLYSKPTEPIRVFADAFRLRREDPDG